ncbi:metallophosphoesterase family protein [Terriglobus albidus]|uniref:metallophosphoesterase family protein n=1 Tax=Terriglobus albidus TaxID=1592106 RepID=UPI0021DFCEE4|nr:metallophosphoesterase [Terriglobus albidus]
MITLLHLSDIHFSQRDDTSQFDLDQQIRRALLDDLEARPADGANYDAVLITGDIAFSGKLADYTKAIQWLDELFSRTAIPAANVYVIPGNHDVDRDYVAPDLPLWESHVKFRQNADPVKWRDLISKQLKKDPLHSMLAPLNAFNDFAQRYDCRTTPEQLAWEKLLPKKFDDGKMLRIHGLNSALISDGGDAPGGLLVSDFQTSHLKHTDGVVDVALCHHPPDWLMDKATIRDALRTFAPVALFGHEHSTRIAADKKHVQLFAGAVQPSRRDPDWLPTYHIVQLHTFEESDGPRLKIRIHTREFNKQNFQFRARRNDEDQAVDEHLIKLYDRPRNNAVVVAALPTVAASHAIPEPEPTEDTMPTNIDSAKRDLIVHFFKLPTPDRYASANEAGLLRDGDDALQPQVMWSQVFQRATEEPNGLAKFWTAVAVRDAELQGSPNPFEE